jgi:hypothetical protein
MKTRNTITRLIAIAIAVAALGWLETAKAQSSDGSVRFVSYASVGIVHGEKIRISVANTAESSGTLSLSFQYYIADGTNSSIGVPFYETELMNVPQGEFRSSGVSREDLITAGEPGTGRAQVMVRVSIVAPAGSDPEDFPSSLDVFADDRGGQSIQTDSKYRLIYVAARRAAIAPIGVLTGHRLSYSLFNPNEEGSQPVRATAYVYDSYGNLLKQTDPVVLRPGQLHNWIFNHDELGGRQVRASIQVVLMDGSVRHAKLPVSFELVNNGTGRTVAGGGPYSTGYVKVSPDE